MDGLYELSFRPADESEGREFEGVLHNFVALESRKPQGESSSVFAHYEATSGRWIVGFETQAALRAFRDLWRTHCARQAAPVAPVWRSAQA
jgi:hypothetical protein